MSVHWWSPEKDDRCFGEIISKLELVNAALTIKRDLKQAIVRERTFSWR